MADRDCSLHIGSTERLIFAQQLNAGSACGARGLIDAPDEPDILERLAWLSGAAYAWLTSIAFSKGTLSGFSSPCFEEHSVQPARPADILAAQNTAFSRTHGRAAEGERHEMELEDQASCPQWFPFFRLTTGLISLTACQVIA